jgi:hypothetical protein
MARKKSQTQTVALAKYLLAMQQVMRLDHWTVELSHVPSSEDAWADIAPHSQALRATLRISPDFWTQTPDKQRQILVHELLHLVTCRMDQVVMNIEESLGTAAFEPWSKCFDDEHERAVDKLAEIISEQFELPHF